MTILQEYNGLDCIATFQLYDELKGKMSPSARNQYELEKLLYAPALFAMTRGILVDTETMDQLRVKFDGECRALEAMLDAITRPLGMGVINIASPAQKMWLLECLGAKVPSKYDPKSGKSRPTTDRDALEKLSQSDPEISPICNIIMAWQNRAKMLSILQPELLDADGRMRTGYKIPSTVTDRWSSGKNCLWTGMNAQNVKRDEDEEEVGHASIRSMFIADPGKKFVNIDLKGADTWAIALEVFAYTGDKSLLVALQTGDVHTTVAKMVWPELGWTGDLKKDKKIAEQFFYRQYDYRFMCKKGGHGTNYYGSDGALAMQMKIPKYKATIFQHKYLRAFPGIRPTQHLIIRDLQTTGRLTNLYGRDRNFHKRLDDNKTHKEAIAWKGQSVTAGTINRALLRAFACQMQIPWLGLEFLAQVHDSYTGQFDDDPDIEKEVVETLAQAMLIPISATCKHTGETITICIPLEISTGWNWAKQGWNKELQQVTTNFDGLREWTGTLDDRKRTKTPKAKKLRFMDRRISGVYRGRK